MCVRVRVRVCTHGYNTWGPVEMSAKKTILEVFNYEEEEGLTREILTPYYMNTGFPKVC